MTVSDTTAREVGTLKQELSGLNVQLSDAARSNNEAVYGRILDVINHTKQQLEHAQARHAEALVHDAQVAKWTKVYGTQTAGEALAAHLTSGDSAAFGKAQQAGRNLQIAEVLYGPQPTPGEQGKKALDLARMQATQAAAAAAARGNAA
jgi:hypothetical protein